MASTTEQQHCEWLLSNGAGTFALGCIDRVPRRKYHSLFSLADGLGPESSSRNMIMDIVELVGSEKGLHPVADPHGAVKTQGHFVHEPLPTWTYELGDARLSRRLELSGSNHTIPHASRPVLHIRYRLEPVSAKGAKPTRLEFEPWMLSRPLHVEMKLNSALWGSPLHGSGKGVWRFQMYQHEPILRYSWRGADLDWKAKGRWEANVNHIWEAERGYESTEDVFIPGRFGLTWNGREPLDFTLDVEWETAAPLLVPETPAPIASKKDSFRTRLASAASAYSAAIRENGALTPTLLAGLPWFGPWGRDFLISVPGYALATQRYGQAYAMIAAMGLRIRDSLKQGNVGGPTSSHRGPATVNLHGVDTPFFFVWAVEMLERQCAESGALDKTHLGVLRELACDIVNAVAHGSYPGVELSADGRIILKPGRWAPTWMDARVDEQPVTPRHGEPIEINALFASALSYLLEREDREARISEPLRELARFVPNTIARRYWRQDLGYFADTLGDGAADTLLRPNQLWLLALDRLQVDPHQAKTALEKIRRELLTPIGLRTLAPGSPGYKGRCEGNQRARDHAYHQGTVWPWLLGAMTDAVVRFDGIDAARALLAPCMRRLEEHLNTEGCIGQISEIFDGDGPHHARGTPAQAWSVTEIYRALEALGL